METTLVPYHLFYPESFKKAVDTYLHKPKKYRKSRTPVKSKIGSPVTDVYALMHLAYTKRSVVVYGRLLPAVNVTMWQLSMVVRMIGNKAILEYKKE